MMNRPTPLRIVIADDEPLARARLRSLVAEAGHEVCAEAGNADEALAALSDRRPDVLLLDIQMPGEDGIALAHRLAATHPSVAVIMVTAHPDHALEAFDAAAHDYLLKPVRAERLARALQRVEGRQKSLGSQWAEARIRVTVGRREEWMRLGEIDCFVAEQGYVLARSASTEGFVEPRLHELEARFGTALLRVHRSCLAVAANVTGIETRSAGDHRLCFRDHLEPVPISRRQLSEVRHRLEAAWPERPADISEP